MAAEPAEQAVASKDTDTPKIDMKEHQATFDGFMALTKWGVIASAVVLLGLLVFLV